MSKCQVIAELKEAGFAAQLVLSSMALIVCCMQCAVAGRHNQEQTGFLGRITVAQGCQEVSFWWAWWKPTYTVRAQLLKHHFHIIALVTVWFANESSFLL